MGLSGPCLHASFPPGTGSSSRQVWRKFFDAPHTAPAPSSESYFAVVMIADISGFTRLTAWLDENIQQGQVR